MRAVREPAAKPLVADGLWLTVMSINGGDATAEALGRQVIVLHRA